MIFSPCHLRASNRWNPGRTRACNLWLRKPTLHPLGHGLFHRSRLTSTPARHRAPRAEERARATERAPQSARERPTESCARYRPIERPTYISRALLSSDDANDPNVVSSLLAAASLACLPELLPRASNKSHSQSFATGARAQVARVRAAFPNQLEYSGDEVRASFVVAVL